MAARPSIECCTFGKMFDAEHDEQFASMSVRTAFAYFAGLRKNSDRQVKKFMIERHRECLGLTNFEPTDEPKPAARAEAIGETLNRIEQEQRPKRESKTEEERKQEIVETYAGLEKLDPRQVEFESRVGMIVATVQNNNWKGAPNVLAMKKAWNVADRYLLRVMESAQAKLLDARGGIAFGREVSVQKTIAIREKALEKEDWKGAISAQKHLDSITGVLASSSVQINQQFNIVEHPQFRTVLNRVFAEIADELEPYPEILCKVQERLARCLSNSQQAPVTVQLTA